MQAEILPSAKEAGIRAAHKGASAIRAALEKQNRARVILATGASQFHMLDELVKDTTIAWGRVDLFHLDEYVGVAESHAASFVGYLKQRFVDRVAKVGSFTFINGDNPDMGAEIARINAAIADTPIDVAFVGIGENGHLAFNDPPANFETEQPFLEVVLDEKCRLQQANEGWFGSIDLVPKRAISMSIRQIMKSDTIICTVPDERKAEAVQNVIEGPVSNLVPASILQTHAKARIFLDPGSASRLSSSSSEDGQNVQ